MFSSMIQNLLSTSGQASAMQRAVQMNNYANSIRNMWHLILNVLKMVWIRSKMLTRN